MRTRKRIYKIPRPYEGLGKYLYGLRCSVGLSQREVSRALGYSSAQFISNFERGIAAPPSKKMRSLLELYDADADADAAIAWLLSGRRVLLANALRGHIRAANR